MGKSDQGIRPLVQRLAFQIGPAIFGHHDMRIIARGCDRTIQPRNNPRDCTAPGRRLAGDDRLAALRRIGAPDKVELPARAAILAPQQMLRIARAAEIDLQRCIHRDDIPVLRDMPRIIDDIDGPTVHRRIVVEKIVQVKTLRPR